MVGRSGRTLHCQQYVHLKGSKFFLLTKDLGSTAQPMIMTNSYWTESDQRLTFILILSWGKWGEGNYKLFCQYPLPTRFLQLCGYCNYFLLDSLSLCGKSRANIWRNTVKGTTDPRIEFCLPRNILGHITSSYANIDQIWCSENSTKHEHQNLNQTSVFRLNSIFKILTKHSLRISTKIKLHNLNQASISRKISPELKILTKPCA